VAVTEQEPEQPAQDPARVRACESCHAPMALDQDWCLECGTAARGRLGQRPGLRAVSTVAALTLALAGGAVAASYAALSDDARVAAQAPAPPSGQPLAQVPPTAPAPAAPTVPPATVPTTPTVPPASVPDASPTPPVATPPSLPKAPAPSPPPSPAPAPTPSPSPTPSSPGDGDGKGGKDEQQDAGDDAPRQIAPGEDFAQLYDPYAKAVDKGDPDAVKDGDAGTSWFVTVPDGAQEVGVGLVLDLEKQRGLRELRIATKTPGFRVEVYASDEDLPPDILDTRWAHLKDRSNVRGGVADPERIVLGSGSAKYRYVALWITTPPAKGSTVRLSEVQVFG
jgi:hypothetical protein